MCSQELIELGNFGAGTFLVLKFGGLFGSVDSYDVFLGGGSKNIILCERTQGSEGYG